MLGSGEAGKRGNYLRKRTNDNSPGFQSGDKNESNTMKSAEGTKEK
jgi:hypothetical protein